MNLKSKKSIIILSVLLTVAVALSVVSIMLMGTNQEPTGNNVPTSADKIDVIADPDTSAPDAVIGGYITAGVDFELGADAKAQIDSYISDAEMSGYNCIVMPVHTEKGALYNSGRFKKATDESLLAYTLSAAHKKGIMVYASIDPTRSPKGSYDVSAGDSLTYSAAEMGNLCHEGVDGIVLEYPNLSDNPSYSAYLKSGSGEGYDSFKEQALFNFVRNLCSEVRRSGYGVCIGVSLPATRFDIAHNWASRGATDFTLVTHMPAEADGENGFVALSEKWIKAFEGVKPLYFMLSAKASLSGEADQLNVILQGEQYVSHGNNGMLADSLSALSGLDKLKEFMNSVNDESFGIRNLSITSPASANFTTYSDTVSFIGASDPNHPLTMNGKEVERTDTGYFSLDKKLTPGKNTFTFEHKNITKTYTVEYKNINIRSIYPSEEQWCDGDVEITVSAIAKSGAKLWARIGDEVKEMTSTGGATNDSADVFATYIASFITPAAQDVPVEMGTLIVTSKLGDTEETKSGGRLVVRAIKTESEEIVSRPAQQVYESGYGIIVGEGDRYVAEVAVAQTETLDIITPIDERSRPTNAYLPQGTVDYCSDKDAVFFNPESGKDNKFRNLDYGKRVYSDVNIKIFKAILPETNTITAVDCTDNGRHTVITFDTAWKAPFNVTLSPQEYTAPNLTNQRPDYSVSQLTYEYLDIEFCYTQSAQGRVDVTGNPIFSSAEWIKGDRGYYVLRLWLKQKGKFYGWTAEYNENNQLQFYFLDPVQITPSTNYYGYSLEGVKIVVDAGHGGVQPGAVGSSKQYTEAVLNLILARKLERELTSLGATVVMTRTADVDITLEERNLITQKEKPDIFISIHRNSSASSASKGYEDYYFHPFSKPLADAVYNRCVNDFTEGRGVRYYPFYVTRVSCCPSILTENGFMSNSADLEMIKTDYHNEKMAVSIMQGVIDYLVSIQLPPEQ